MLHIVIVANTCHFPHQSVAFLAGETAKFSTLQSSWSAKLCPPSLPKLNATLKSMCQIRDVITRSVSFIFRENEFAADNKASLSF